MSKPTIVIVPGFWLGPRPYELLAEELQTKGLTDVVYAPLASTGTQSPNNPTMHDDAQGIRKVIGPLVSAGKHVVIVAHSAGGFLSGMATEGLELGQAPDGGVERFIFVAAGILPVGASHPPVDWDVRGNEMWPNDIDDTMFHDVDADVAAKHCKPFLKSQPLMKTWDGTCNYTGWEKAPSTYILTENDRVISPEVQEMCSGLAKSEVVRIPTGHLPMLSEPKLLAEKIVASLKRE